MAKITNDEIMSLLRDRKRIDQDWYVDEQERACKIMALESEVLSKLKYLVCRHASRYKKMSNYEDLVQEGTIGLLKAIRKFDPDRYPNFFVYCERWINNGIKRAAKKFDIVYNPTKKRTVYSGLKQIDEEAPNINPEEAYFNQEVRSVIDSALGKFDPRDQDIVNRIFGLNGYCPHSLREIGPIYNITHERVRQIRDSVVSGLKRNHDLAEFV